MDTSTNETQTPTPPLEEHRNTGQPILGLDRRTPRMRVDLTINLPTIISIAVLIVTTSATGVGLYYSLDKRQMATDFAVTALSQRLDKNELAVSALKTEHAVQTQALRGEMRSDITEIKDLLNRLIFAPQGVSQQQQQHQQRQQLKEWSK
jgi:hypothetical protein